MVVYCSARRAKSVEMELIATSSVRILTIHCFASSVTSRPMRVLAMVGSSKTVCSLQATLSIDAEGAH